MQWLSALIAYFAIWISILSDVIECDAVVRQAVLIVSIVWIYNGYVILPDGVAKKILSSVLQISALDCMSYVCSFLFLVAIIANHCFWGKNRFTFIKCLDLGHRHCSSLTLGRI